MRQLFTKILLHKQFQKLGIYGFGQCFNLVTPLLVMPYIISVCGIDNYGKISIGMAISFFLMVFIDYGSDINGVKEIAINRENKSNLERVFVTTFIAKFILLVLTLIASSLLFLFIPFFQSEKEMFFLGLPILIGQFLNPTWFLQGLENFKWITVLTIFSKIVYVVGIFAFINVEQDYIFINLFWGIGTIIAHGSIFIFILKTYKFSFKNNYRKDTTILLKNNFSLFTSQIFVSLQMYAPLMLIGFLGNNTMAGQFKIIDQIIVIFKTYILLFFNYMYPRVCYLLDKNLREALKFWKTYNGLNLAFISLSMMLIYVFSYDVVDFFNPIEKEEITNLLRVAVFIPFLQGITVPLKQLILGINKQKQYINITIFLTVVCLLLFLLFIPGYKVMGVLSILIISEIAIIALFYYNIKNEIFSSQV